MVLAMIRKGVRRARIGKRMGYDEARDPHNHESSGSGGK